MPHLNQARAAIIAAIIVAVSVSAGVSGCTDPDRKPRAGDVRGVTDDRIRLGTYGPLTGPAAAWGVSLRAMKAYFEDLNAHGGIHGRQIELLLRDDQYSPAKTPAAVRGLVDQANVFAIVGGIGTANGRSVAPYLQRKGVPFYSPASGAAFFSSPPKPNLYTVYVPYALEGQLIGEFIVEHYSTVSVGVLHQDDDFGASGAAGLKTALAARGAKLKVEVTCLPTDTDLTGQVTRVVNAKPDVLVLYTAPRQGALAARQLAQRGFKPKLVTSFVLADQIMFELAGTELWEGTITASPYRLANDDHPSVERYRRVMAERAPGLPIGAFTLAAFAWAQPLAGALDMAGPHPTPEKLYAAFERMRGWNAGGPHWPAGNLTAPVTFGPNDHLGVDRVFFAQATKGRWTKLTGWRSIHGRSTPVDEEKR